MGHKILFMSWFTEEGYHLAPEINEEKERRKVSLCNESIFLHIPNCKSINCNHVFVHRLSFLADNYWGLDVANYFCRWSSGKYIVSGGDFCRDCFQAFPVSTPRALPRELYVVVENNPEVIYNQAGSQLLNVSIHCFFWVIMGAM